MKTVIIGGVATGPKVGSRINRLCPDAQVTLIEKGEFLSYAGCGLPYYVSGVVESQEELMSTAVGTVRDTVFFQNVKNIKVFNRTEATKIDRKNKKVEIKDLKTGDIKEIDYDKLVFATGASPLLPPIKGVDLENVFTLHGVEDAEGIKKAFKEKKAKNIAIVGGGLIGIEMAEAFGEMGAKVRVFERLPQILPFLDWEMAKLASNHLEEKGVSVHTNTAVNAICGDGYAEKISTDEGDFLADLVVVSVGVRPNVKLAQEAGLQVGEFGGICVNKNLQTSDEDIYAGGDCVETYNRITEKCCFMPLGSTANKHGRVIANNICGIKDEFLGVINTAICKVFDYGVASCGLSERQAKEEGYCVETVLSPAPDKAHFYPTAKPIMLKLVIDKKTRRLLGMQAVGAGEIDKRIDVAVTSITASMSVDDIANLDLAYAPPFSPAIDNIITAANIARNKLDNVFKAVSPMEVKAKIDKSEDFVFLDVRTPDEFDEIHLKNSKLMPLGKLRSESLDVPKDKEIIVFCKISLRGYEAALILKHQGFTNVKVMDGGVLMWPYEKIS